MIATSYVILSYDEIFSARNVINLRDIIRDSEIIGIVSYLLKF